MSIHNKTPHFYNLCGQILKQVKESPYLGLTISEDLTWTNHIIKICKKANSTMALLRRNLRHCPVECKKMAYLSLVRANLDYGSIIYDPNLQTDIDRLERIQKQAARFITSNYISKEPGCVTKMLKNLFSCLGR